MNDKRDTHFILFEDRNNNLNRGLKKRLPQWLSGGVPLLHSPVSAYGIIVARVIE
jgi:hypothetical protein